MDRLRQFFKSNPRMDSLLIASWDASAATDPNFLYHTGLSIDRATFIAKRGSEPVLIVNPLNEELAKEKFKGELSVFKPGEYRELLSKHLRSCKSLAVDKSAITASLYENILKATRAKVFDASEAFALQRACKDEDEISATRRAAQIARKAFKELYFRPGRTELELQFELQALLLEYGAEPSFRPIIGFGKNSRFPHAESGHRKINRGEIMLVDWGAKWGNYCSDHTRCVFVGEPDYTQWNAYCKLQDVFKEIISFLRPGMPVQKVAKQYHSLLEDAGLPLPPHGLGHGIGLEVHEYPSFAKISTDHLVENSTLAIEPACYFKTFGVRFEDTIFLKKRATRV